MILEASTERVLKYLQITQAIDGYDYYLRNLHLDQHRHAPTFGPTLQKKPVTGNTIETYCEAFEAEEEGEDTFNKIFEAVKQKGQMRYESETALIVEYPRRAIGDQKDKDALALFAKEYLINLASKFCELYLVNSGGDFGLKFKIKCSMIAR